MFVWYDSFDGKTFFVSGPFSWAAEFPAGSGCNFCSMMIPPEGWDCE